MDKTIKRVLELIEESGFEAYVVGGYVRDFLLKIKSTDIDICTNARPKDLTEIFKDYNTRVEDYGSFKIISDRFTFDITTYRKESNYEYRKPTKIEYIDNLIQDLNRRDLTINAICMNSKGMIIDLLNGILDIKSKTIRMIGDVDTKLKEDPLRILRALRFASSLGFDIEETLLCGINLNKHLVQDLSNTRKKEEIEKILVGKNCLVGLSLLKEYEIDKYLGIRYAIVKYTEDLCGMYAQMEFDDFYSFTKGELKNIKLIKEVITYGKIDENVLFDYGLYVCTVAGEIFGISRKDVTCMYDQLPIKQINEINITSKEIISILQIEPSVIIKSVQNELKTLILKGVLSNDRTILEEYLIINKGMWC